VATERLVTGKLRLDAEVRGEAVRAVTFALDGRPVLTKKRPPYGVELDLGRTPRLQRVSAAALDQEGRELARDERVLNGGPHRFALRLVEPRAIPPGAERVTARAEIDLPEGEALERVEFWVDDRLHATLYQPPFVQSLPVPRGPAAWIRAAGYLAGGGAAEDVRLVGPEEYASAVEVDFVELFATITDRRGRTIEDLRPEEVVLEEAGVPQALRRFELLRDLPIHAGLLLDTSASMAEELEEAERAALRFFEDVLTDRDRAAVVTFADAPRLAVRFTRSLEVLAGGLAGLEAEGETKIWDALAFALHYFSGLRGKRALVLLSDGVDSGSRFAIADVLEYARRTGVAIYAIGISVPRYPPDAGMYLDQIARETGGRSYRIERAVELGPIYQTIERELRAQYLLAYQSSHPEREGFRPIELKVKRPGAQVATAAGYYP
jgi:VWFA-related protein